MKIIRKTAWLSLALLALAPAVQAFEGQIKAALSQNMQTDSLLYTVGPDHMRIELSGTNWPNPVDILERQTGELTVMFPHNRSFVRLKTAAQNEGLGVAGMPMLPSGIRPGIGPRPASMGMTGLGNGTRLQASCSMPTGLGLGSAAPRMPAMPEFPAPPQVSDELPPKVGPQADAARTPARIRAMPPMMTQQPDLRATGQITNILGFACQQYELKQRGEAMDIWATDQLPPFQPYVRSQLPRLGPRLLEDEWAGLVARRKLFPMLASLRQETRAESVLFKVTSVNQNKITEPARNLFQPPVDYRETQPLPF